MSEYYLIVNPAKRQYLNSYDMGDWITWSGVLRGHHGRAVALLTCNFDQVPTYWKPEKPPLLGSWWGDPIIVVGDYAPPDTHGIKTSTEDEPKRNLYQMAEYDFENISYPAIALLCEFYNGEEEPYAELLANEALEQAQKGWGGNRMLMHLGTVAFQFHCLPLREALDRVYGSHWTQDYKKAKEYEEEHSHSFIDYRGRGGWFGDIGLSLWLLFLVSEIDARRSATGDAPEWLLEVRDEWYLQAIAGTPNRITLNLDRYLTTDEKRDTILALVQQALDRLSTFRQYVRLSDDWTISQGTTGDMKSDDLRSLGKYFAKILRGEVDMRRR